jgi:hypothetical protein
VTLKYSYFGSPWMLIVGEHSVPTWWRRKTVEPLRRQVR